MKKILCFIIMLTYHHVHAGDIDITRETGLDCLFEENHIYYEIDSAKKDAQRSFYEGVFYIYVVSNGFAPERPGVENDFEIFCLELEQRPLWMGADVSGQCNQKTWSTLNKKSSRLF